MRQEMAAKLMAGPWAVTSDGLRAHYALLQSGLLSSRDIIAEMAPRIRARDASRRAGRAVMSGDYSMADACVVDMRAGSGENLEPAYDAHIRSSGIGVIPYSGVMMTHADLCWEGYDSRAAAGRAMIALGVDTIVMHMDTPGGQCQGGIEHCQELRAWQDAGVTLIAVIEHHACSMGYWLASQADSIVASPSSIYGHMGAFTEWSDITGALGKEGIRHGYISEGAGKTDTVGDDTERPAGDQDRSRERVMRPITRHFYEAFLADVGLGRGSKLTAEDARSIGAMLYPGDSPAGDRQTGMEAGLIDGIETMETVLARLEPDEEIE